MLKLYGFSVSNYYNMVKLALLEKGLPFEEVPFYAGQTPEALAVSPRGKVPVLGVEQGFINETSVILEYLEQTQGGRSLLPSEPFQRAQVLALCREIELYIELPARACFAEAFFGMPVPEAIKEKSRAELLLGIASLGRHGKFLFGLDLLAELPKAKALLERLQALPNAQRVAADKEAAMPAFMAMVA
eukprot:gene19732-23470_t